MRIGIDARLYGIAHRGLGRYVQQLVDGLIKIDQQNHYVFFLTKENFNLLKVDNPRIKKVLLTAHWYSLKEQFSVPWIIKKEKIDLMHFPHFNVPLFSATPFMVTIHDLIIKHFPDSRATTLPNWQYQLKLRGFNCVLKRALLKSVKIIVPSNFVKSDIINNFKIDEEKIKVVYEGYSLNESYQFSGFSRFNITKPFLLYVGAAYPHKNLDRLIRVFKKINQKNKYQLVLVGLLDFFYQKLRKAAGNYPDIIFTGFVSEGELAALYQQALVYVFPSLAEGFGLPPLEAQAYQLPVVSASNSSLPEVLADSSLYFNPLDEKEMLKKITLALEDDELRRRLVARGQANIKRFSWQKMVKETMDLYHTYSQL